MKLLWKNASDPDVPLVKGHIGQCPAMPKLAGVPESLKWSLGSVFRGVKTKHNKVPRFEIYKGGFILNNVDLFHVNRV